MHHYMLFNFYIANPFQPYDYVIEYCHIKSMSGASLPLTGAKCQEITLDGARGEHMANLSHLEPFAEYNITVTGRINPFKRNRSTSFISRTRKCKKVVSGQCHR